METVLPAVGYQRTGHSGTASVLQLNCRFLQLKRGLGWNRTLGLLKRTTDSTADDKQGRRESNLTKALTALFKNRYELEIYKVKLSLLRDLA